MRNFLKNLFGKVAQKVFRPHICVYKCVGYCSHYGMVSEIKKSIENLSWHHYPSQTVMKSWLASGFDYARVFQSHWQCSCGKNQIFFFLAHPSLGYGERPANSDTVSKEMYSEMITFNPFNLKSSRGKSLDEVTGELINKFC